MRKIIVTGSTSMIGTALIDVAVREGVEVYAIVRPETKRENRLNSSPLVHIVYGSLETLDKINEIPADCDILYHFAWKGTDKQQRNNPFIQEKNIKYTLDAVKLAEKCGCTCFIGSGSQAEYGPVYGIINENTVPLPASSYGISKYAAGLLSKNACETRNIKHIWGRVFSVYGPHDNKGTMIDYAMDCFVNNKTAHFSSGEQYWNYLYESDAGELFFRLGSDYIPEGTYLIANTESRLLKWYIKTMANCISSKSRMDFVPLSRSKMPGLYVDNSLTTSIVKYKSQVKFEDGIKKTISFVFPEIEKSSVGGG